MEIRLLFDHREDLVKERTRMQNRLRWHLLELCPALEAKLAAGALSNQRQLERLDRQLRRIGAGPRARIAREQLAHIRALTRQADRLESELLALVGAYRPRLLEEQGCGALTAALLIGRTAGAERFRSDACFGRQSGTAPIPCSSGKRTQHRLDRGGDRQLNRALHTIVITRAQDDSATREYLARNRPRAKAGRARCGPSSAISRAASGGCSPSRHWNPSKLPSAPPPPAERTAEPAEPEPITIPQPSAARREVQRIAAAIPMVCIT